MISYLLNKIVGSQNQREIKRLRSVVEEINVLEERYSKLTNVELQEKTESFRKDLKERFSLNSIDEYDEDVYQELEEYLFDILPDAFAIVREASRRTIGMRHFDVQLIGGIVLHKGRIAEMKTGEGKTLVAALPLYLNGLTGLGAHLVTVNDYLASRDALWMGPIYKLLGLQVGVINHDASYLVDWEDPQSALHAIRANQSVWPEEYLEMEIPPEKNLEALSAFKTRLVPCSRKEAYNADITYGTNNEFGFDYLRDNMKFSLEDYVQRGHNYAIIDEVDSILIDEARTPLIISGPSEDSTQLYYEIDKVVRGLKKDEDFIVDEKSRQVNLTDSGASKIERIMGLDNLYDPTNLEVLHHVNQALRAHHLFQRDVDYMVKDGKVIIVDEFTGRLMPGRRWSDGLHQAVEAKEGVNIESENQTLATITIQNFFRMYRKLAGMTGTADTEAFEFKSIYNMDVNVIPTHKPVIRKDYDDLVYRTQEEKFEAVCSEIEELHSQGRPILVGTTSIEQSEKLSKYLTKRKLPHRVLNAKYHAKEAEIIAQAGRVGAITIATNMAGRGTDILLGGNPEFLAKEILIKKYKVDPQEATSQQFEEAFMEAKAICSEERKKVIELGGLHIIGTERHEARRIDNQLRGRAGRQGDPGSSRFYVSLEDDLMRIFASDRIRGIMDKLGWERGKPIEHKMISRSIENAQKKVEARNFDIRKHLLEYDDVLNTQRDVVYRKRKEILSGGISLKENLMEIIDELSEDLVQTHLSSDKGIFEQNEITELKKVVKRVFDLDLDFKEMFSEPNLNRDSIREYISQKAKEQYEKKEQEIGTETLREIERFVMLQTLDYLWKDHLLNMDHLREGIGLRGYAQKDPLYEYKREGFELFSSMMSRFNEEVCEKLFKVKPLREVDMEEVERKRKAREQKMIYGRGDNEQEQVKQPIRKGKKVGRNEPCPCGSGLKYKKCCGK